MEKTFLRRSKSTIDQVKALITEPMGRSLIYKFHCFRQI